LIHSIIRQDSVNKTIRDCLYSGLSAQSIIKRLLYIRGLNPGAAT
jgi:hypothetical protein